MKTLWLVLCVGLAITQSSAQKLKTKDVPVNIKNSFEKNYDVKNVDWEKEGANYEASFKKTGKEISVVFDEAGSILETENEIDKSELPAAILDALKKDYPDFELEEAARIDSKGVITYEAEVEKGKQSFDLIFNSEGKLIKKEAEEDKGGKD